MIQRTSRSGPSSAGLRSGPTMQLSIARNLRGLPAGDQSKRMQLLAIDRDSEPASSHTSAIEVLAALPSLACAG